jgi:DNA polymerase Ligase (LigD)
MLIWDTGEYSVLPYHGSPIDSDAESGDDKASNVTATDSEKLRHAFQQRKIRLRLHGTRLPQGYTLAIRADKDHFPTEQPRKSARTRRRKNPKSARGQKRETPSSEGSDTDQP